jgi:hypothetical protein
MVNAVSYQREQGTDQSTDKNELKNKGKMFSGLRGRYDRKIFVRRFVRETLNRLRKAANPHLPARIPMVNIIFRIRSSLGCQNIKK